jgi:hypothetical protein
MGISWSQLLKRNNQHIINNGQLQVHIGAGICLGMVHILPNPMITVRRHALVKIAGREGHDNGTHPGKINKNPRSKLRGIPSAAIC